jgi:hypothetical protein
MDKDERIAELEVALRRGIATIRVMAPWVLWDGHGHIRLTTWKANAAVTMATATRL